jgi:hypothetical protein
MLYALLCGQNFILEKCGCYSRPGRKRRKEIFELKIGFLNLPRLWKFAQGDLGEILS